MVAHNLELQLRTGAQSDIVLVELVHAVFHQGHVIVGVGSVPLGAKY